MDSIEENEVEKKRLPALKLITGVIFLIIVASFTVANLHDVQLNYYDYTLHVHSVQLPLLGIVIASFAMGFLIAWIFGFFKEVSLSWKTRGLKDSLRAREAQLKKLKSLPPQELIS